VIAAGSMSCLTVAAHGSPIDLEVRASRIHSVNRSDGICCLTLISGLREQFLKFGFQF